MTQISPENTEETAIRNLMTPELHESLDNALKTLSEREREIFTSHFLDGTTYFDLSLEYGIPEKRIGRIVQNAKSGLRGVTSLRQYLDMIP